MESNESAQSLLLALPDPCLVAILQCCAANNQRSLLSAARAHSRLHQAAVLVLRSITAVITEHQQADSVLMYLGNHSLGDPRGQHGTQGCREELFCSYPAPPAQQPAAFQP
jgi:hypothetical protein